MERQLTLGMQVKGTDGQAGRISRIVTDPETQRPTYLVVKHGRMHPREVVVPVSLVQEVTPEAVALDLKLAALNDFPDFESTVQHGTFQRTTVAPQWRPMYSYTPPTNDGFMMLRQRAVPEQAVAVAKGMAVHDCDDHEVGTVEGIIVDAEKRQGSHLILRRTHPLLRLLVVPVELVDEAAEERVRLRISREYVDGLPTYTEG